MKWKDLAIGRKLGIGFGIVLVLLTIISLLAYLEFINVNHLAHDAEEMAENDRFVLMKTIDHLNWVSKLSDLVFNEKVHNVDLQTDPHKCGFGKWLYSQEAKKMAARNKEIGKLIEAIKEPHQQLHQSAIKITDTYVDFDLSMESLVAERWVDHLVWIKDLSRSLLTETPFKRGVDPNACAFGKWYHSHKATNPDFEKLLKGWKKPHDQLHVSAQKIVERMQQNDMEGARFIYQEETLLALEKLQTQYLKTIGWIDHSVEKREATKMIFYENTLPALSETRKILDQIGELYHQQFQKDENGMIDSIINAEIKTATLSIVAIAVGIVTAIFIALGITRPIAKGVIFANAMSEGDLTRTLDIDQKDEIGNLAIALNKMAGNFRKMFNDILSSVDTIASSSTELSAVSQQLSSGAEQTSNKSNQVSEAAEQMSSNMNSVAAACEQSSTNVQMVAAASEQMSATINEISGNTEKGRLITNGAVSQANLVSTRVAELGKAAVAVGKVTETINDISEQTNLLALNATIEAARAGEAGKGFAVVANEIKDLAKQTAEATQDIRLKIEGIQNSTESTVTEIDQIEKVITDVDEIVGTIATAVEEQSASTKEIANNVNQAAQGIQDVNEKVAESSTVSATIATDVKSVNQASDEIANGSVQVNQSAGELSCLAEDLKRMMAQFKV